VSRNAPVIKRGSRSLPLRSFVLACACLIQNVWSQSYTLPDTTNAGVRVVVVTNAQATEAYHARRAPVEEMVRRGIIQLTGATTEREAWLSVVSTQDVVGIKVYSKPGPNSGTRPAVVVAVAKGLIAAGIPSRQVVVWDRDEANLREAGYYRLGEELNIRVQAAASAGWDTNVYYDSSLIGSLVFGDAEFGQKGDSVGRRSFVSKLVTRELTKILNVTPLLNHNAAGVCGNLYSLGLGSTDNILRFEDDPQRLSTAIPEILALPALYDRVVLHITDALICQYEGGHQGLLHYSSMLNQLRFSRDPVALDVLSIKELDVQRRKARSPNVRPNLELYRNAELLQLGVADPNQIRLEKFP